MVPENSDHQLVHLGRTLKCGVVKKQGISSQDGVSGTRFFLLHEAVMVFGTLDNQAANHRDP